MSKTAEDWKKERDEADRIRNENAKALSELQRNAIKQAWEAIQRTEFSLQEMFDVTMDDCRAISKAEWRLRSAFPELCELRCTCDD